MKKRVLLASAAILSTTVSLASLPASAALPMAVDGQQLPSLAPMLENVTPAVVSISVNGTQVSRQRVPEMFRYFFGPNAPEEQVRERPFRGLGSGVIIDADKGYIVTNHHVIDGADTIKVGLNDGREFEAKLIGSDSDSDVALLQIEAKRLTQVHKANSDKVRVGDFTVAIGNPFGLGQTVTSGIVSALGRSGLGIESLENFIQTDAAINSGNSGGALVNLRGELVGINTAIVAPGGGNVGIGFAIPINMVDNLVDQILEFGEVRRGVLGVLGRELDNELAQAFGLETKHGAFVSQVMEDSAAAEAGLEAGDIIVSINGNPIKSFQALRAKVGTYGAGAKVTLGVIRDGKKKNFKVTLAQADMETASAENMHPSLTGATLANGDNSVIIREVAPNSPAAAVGLKKGDEILGVNRTRIKGLKSLRDTLDDTQGAIALNVKRDNSQLYIVLR
ncbi:Do family serine endopeptidase [Paraferrimonas haliotis]|uniref:Serine endoprotease DegQ n=1 Tax=Paraferrimonas haliotis TaxID=2013866 RepID=A0AA37TQ78_9GAMM|nr:Do family serine endopeptidase [Paraferrimonas haliotis]GLS83385.1 serine endoprotease DegQ [Paraferrimonas haliotis]